LCRAVRRCFSSSALSSVNKTVLYDDHVRLGGKMVEFAGYMLPVQYSDSLISSHNQVRNSSGLFDVSHMGQLRLWGEKRIQFLEELVVGDIQALKSNQARLTVLTNEQGGIIDDCMVTNKPDHLYMVINAGNSAGVIFYYTVLATHS
jgi:aminomethyltransferase